MPLDATVAGASSNSYITLADANTMAAAAGLNSWATKTDAEKEAALLRATQEIDAHRFHAPEKYKSTQALAFPRSKDSGVILNAVKWAQVYQADWLAVSGEADRGQWEGAKAGPLKDSGAGSPLAPRAFRMLARLISRTGQFTD